MKDGSSGPFFKILRDLEFYASRSKASPVENITLFLITCES